MGIGLVTNKKEFISELHESNLMPRSYTKGEVIMSHWKDNYASVFLEEGILKMTSDNSSGTVFNLQHISSEQLILSNSIVDDEVMCKYDLEVVSDTVKIYFITAEELKTVVCHSRGALLYTVNSLQKQVTFLWSKLSDFSINGKIGSLCGQLLIWSYLFGEKKETEITIQLKVTLQDLGCACGIAHISAVSRLLTHLKKEEAIRIKKGQVSILDLDKLKEYSPKIEEWFKLNELEKWLKLNNQSNKKISCIKE